MILPGASFYIANTVASKFQIKDKYLELYFNPEDVGILSPQVLPLLEEIAHPPLDADTNKIDYKMIMDENILNAWAIDMGQVKEVLSLRSFASTFDPSATYIKWLSTSLLSVNMPELVKQYGKKS